MFYRDNTSTPHFMKVNFSDFSLKPSVKTSMKQG